MNYLFFRNDGIGDLIVTSSIFSIIKKNDSLANIYLIVSERNYEYAKILKKSGHINELVIFNGNKSKLSNFINILFKIGFQRFHHIYLLKINSFNIFVSIFLQILNLRFKFQRIISSLVMLNTKAKKNKYSPPTFFYKHLFFNYEIIDNRYNHSLSKNIHMSEHFFDLYNSSLLNNINILNDKFNLKYAKPISEEKQIKIKSNLIIQELFLNNRETSFILFHFDEKWDLSNHKAKTIKEFLIKLQIESGYKIIVTDGIFKNIYYDSLLKLLDEKPFKSNVSKKLFRSEINKNIFILSKLPLIDLMSLITICKIIITPHGSVTHLSDIYNKKLVDLIPIDKKNYLSKWKLHNTDQYDLNNLELVLEKILLEIKSLN